MQIKLDKLGITVEFVAGQTYELEFDSAPNLDGKYCFVPNIGFKPVSKARVVSVKPVFVERNCISISNLTDEELRDENVKLKENLKILNEAIETKNKVDNAIDVVKRYEKGELTPEQARDLLSK